MLTTTPPQSARARSMRLACPECSAPMVGTNPILAPARRSINNRRRKGSTASTSSGGISGRRRDRTVFRDPRISPRADVADVVLDGSGDGHRELRVLLYERGDEAIEQAEHVVGHQHLSVA